MKKSSYIELIRSIRIVVPINQEVQLKMFSVLTGYGGGKDRCPQAKGTSVLYFLAGLTITEGQKSSQVKSSQVKLYYIQRGKLQTWELPTTSIGTPESSLLFWYSLTCNGLGALNCSFEMTLKMGALENPYFEAWLLCLDQNVWQCRGKCCSKTYALGSNELPFCRGKVEWLAGLVWPTSLHLKTSDLNTKKKKKKTVNIIVLDFRINYSLVSHESD